MAKKIDPSKDIIDRILSSSVPERGRLDHPIQPKKRPGTQGAQIALSDILKKDNGLPDDIHVWTSREFVKFFGRQFQEKTGGNYRLTFASDGPTFNDIMNFLASNGLDKHEWTKRLIEWGFERRDEIIKREGYLTPQALRSQVNYFYQDRVIPALEQGTVERDTSDVSLLKEIQEVLTTCKPLEAFEHFGIPITMTYFVNIKKYDETKLIAAAKDRFTTLKNSGSKGRQQVERIFRRSLILSPYPPEFVSLNWREDFKEFTKSYEGENWWRSEDFHISPQAKYNALLCETATK